MNSPELTHHGIKGMKWGIRRFQNRDGSLTAAGKKRRDDDPDSNRKKRGSTDSPEKETAPVAPKKKGVKEMDDDELRTKVNRLQMEKQYLDLERQVSSLSPKEVNKGKALADHIGTKIIGPAATEAARASVTKFMTKSMSDALGVSESGNDRVKALEKEWKMKNFKKQIHELEMYFENERRAGRMD